MKPIKTKIFRSFLKGLGLVFLRTKGSHEIWDYPSDSPKSILRPIVFQGAEKDIPGFHIATNLDTLGISREEFESRVS